MSVNLRHPLSALTRHTDSAPKIVEPGLPSTLSLCYARHMALSDRQLLDALSRTPFVDSAELAGILGEPHATVHRALTGLLAPGIVGRVSHGTAHLPSSQRYHLTTKGIRQATGVLGLETSVNRQGL